MQKVEHRTPAIGCHSITCRLDLTEYMLLNFSTRCAVRSSQCARQCLQASLLQLNIYESGALDATNHWPGECFLSDKSRFPYCLMQSRQYYQVGFMQWEKTRMI